MKPSKGVEFVAVVESFGFQGRHWKKGETGVLATDKEAKKMPENQFRCFDIKDVKADKAAQEKAEEDEKRKRGSEQALDNAEKEARDQEKEESEDRAEEKERQAKAKSK